MVHLVHDTNGGRLSYQSSWMSRWMRTSCNMTGKSHDSSSNASVNDLNYITKDVLVTSRSVNGLGMIETVTSELVNDSQRLSAESLRNERSCGHLFKDGQESDDKGASAHEIGRKFEFGKAIYLKNGIQFQPVLHGVPAVNVTSFRGCHFLDAVTSKNNQLDHANLRILQHEGRDTLSQPTGLDSDKKKECQSQSNISLNDSFTENSTPLLFYTPSVRDHHFPKVQKLLGHGPSPSQYLASSKTGSKKSCFECYSLHKLPHCVHDAETMKISTTLDSVEGGHSASSDKAFNTEASSDSSKTPGLEVKIPMECADQAKQKSNLCMDNSPKAEPGYRWVKRLKLSSFALGTKSINLAENSSRKRNKFFSRILKRDITRSESTLRIHHCEESMALDKSINLSKENLGNDLSLSHVWIQRWLRDGSKSTKKKPFTMVDCESQSLKWALEDLQKDRSPSIRAMALMGKAIKSFQPCQLEKRGYLTIWNTKAV